MKFVVLLCLVASVVACPTVTRTSQEIESFRSFLENTQKENEEPLSARMAVNPKAKEWENSGKYQGDIILDDEQIDAMVDDYVGRNAYIWPNSKWPADTIVYEFGEGEFDYMQQAAIIRGIEEIERNTCIKFRLRNPGEVNYVRLTGRPDGCYAHVGYWQPRGVHTYNLARNTPGSGCFRHTTIIHEWLHIIGMLHMQSTYNRDNYVDVKWENMWPGMEHNFDYYSRDVVSNLGLPYEYDSNMHYGGYGFSTNGEPTLVPYYDYLHRMGQTEYVTTVDWLRVNRHYDCPGAWW
ncbi:zinc metalloproteinase nas-4 [Amyelois transitella]|uniref:zinc metalloproteinase nas-4 n=1 Tax=Amyelois transitella TaxID=680683 RepID=UPI00298FB0AD|nr:zinc metalloproteinase nas-4 [Amyelois transitella]